MRSVELQHRPHSHATGARPGAPGGDDSSPTRLSQAAEGAQLSAGARALLGERSASTKAASLGVGVASARDESVDVRTATLDKHQELPKEPDEPSALVEAANWFYESVIAAFASAAARQLGEVAETAWNGVAEVSTKAVEFVVNATLLVVGSGISAVQTLLGLEQPGRDLDANERRWLHDVFGAGLDADRIQLKTGFAGVASLSDRPFSFGNTIYLKNAGPPPADATEAQLAQYRATLIHEAVHVWQHQHGNTPMAESIWQDRVVGNAYDWRAGFAEGNGFHELNVEQQAQFLEDAVRGGYFEDPAAGFHVAGVDYTCQLEQALRELRRH